MAPGCLRGNHGTWQFMTHFFGNHFDGKTCWRHPCCGCFLLGCEDVCFCFFDGFSLNPTAVNDTTEVSNNSAIISFDEHSLDGVNMWSLICRNRQCLPSFKSVHEWSLEMLAYCRFLPYTFLEGILNILRCGHMLQRKPVDWMIEFAKCVETKPCLASNFHCHGGLEPYINCVYIDLPSKR